MSRDRKLWLVGIIVVVGALARRALFHAVLALKEAQMNVQQCSLIREIMRY